MWKKKPNFKRSHGYSFAERKVTRNSRGKIKAIQEDWKDSSLKKLLISLISILFLGIRKGLFIASLSVSIGFVGTFLSQRDAYSSRVLSAWSILGSGIGGGPQSEALRYLSSWKCYGLDAFLSSDLNGLDYSLFGEHRINLPRVIAPEEESFYEQFLKHICIYPSSFDSFDFSSKNNADEPRNKIQYQHLDLKYLNFSYSTLNYVSFRKVYFYKSLFTKASFDESFFSETKFKSVYTLGLTRFKKTFWANSEILDSTVPRSNFSGSTFFFGVVFKKNNFEHSSFNDSDFGFGSSFQNNYMERADFRNSVFSSSFFGNNIEKADFRGAEFSSKIEPCDFFKQNTNWELAYRDEEYACGATVPDPTEKDRLEAKKVSK
ncbi:hypothetical protein L4C37_13205 [Vibrio kagoshimensis]|uniref:pentapeptide repeat-containing protein n=1 Tax=Vibrio kagoshimensis TaxID=2910244 RepID=UPI003D1CBB73